MSASGGAAKFSEESSVNLMENKSKICIQPRFAKHTESSLRKTKIPLKSNKKSSTLEVKRLQENLAFSRLNGISKKQNKIMKHRQSMQTLKTILKQKQRRTSGFLQDNKLTETVCQPKQYAENLLVSLQGDLIKYSPKNCARSPAKSQALRDEICSIRSLSVCPQDDIKSISNCSGDRTILNITCKLQSQANDEENLANSYCKIEVLHRRFRFEKPIEKSTESIAPTNSTELTEPKKPTECIEFAESTELIKSTGSTESTEPSECTESTEPTECVESTEPIKPMESTESTKLIKSTGSTESTEPSECTESIEPTECIESTEPIKPTESTESTKLIKSTGSTESIEPTECTESTEPIKPIKLTEPIEFTESIEPAEDCFNNKIEEQMFQQNVFMNLNATTNYRSTQETLINKKIEIQNEPNLKLARNSKFTKHVDYSKNEDIEPIINNNVVFDKKKGVLKKNAAFTKTQRVWRPPNVRNSSHIENVYMVPSAQPTLRKPSRSTKKYFPPTKNECAESFDNELSASVLTNQCKEMKENRDPCVNRMTKICESLIELKQQQRIQSTEMFRRKKSANKVDSKVSKKYNDDNPKKSKPESKSRHWQTRLITPTRSSKTRNDIEQHHLDPNQISKKSKPLEVIHALKGIIKNIKEHEHADINAVSISKDGVLNCEETEFLTLPNKKTFSKITRKNNARFTKNKNLNEANQSVNKSHKSVSTQTKLNSSLHLEIDSNNGLDSKEILKKSTQTVATQTSLCRNKSVVDVACNTTVCNVACKNVGVFCDLIDSTNMKAKIDSTAIQNKSVLEDILIQTNESSSIESVEIKAGNKCPNDNEKTLSVEMSLKLKDYVGMENDAQCEDMIVPELEVENIPSQVIADFELTAERARNLYEAIIIYRSLMSRKFERRQEEYALEVWNGSFEMNRTRNALVLPTATEKISISRENLLPFVYCVLCILLFWCLQFSFKCDFAM